MQRYSVVIKTGWDVPMAIKQWLFTPLGDPLYVLSCLTFKVVRAAQGNEGKPGESTQGLLQGPLQKRHHLEMNIKHKTATKKKRLLLVHRTSSSTSNGQSNVKAGQVGWWILTPYTSHLQQLAASGTSLSLPRDKDVGDCWCLCPGDRSRLAQQPRGLAWGCQGNWVFW